MKRIRITIEIDVRDDLRRTIDAEAIKLAAIADRRGKVVYVATEIVTDTSLNTIINDR